MFRKDHCEFGITCIACNECRCVQVCLLRVPNMILNVSKCIEVYWLGMDGGGSERLPAAGGARLHPPESSPGVVGCGGEDGRLLVHNSDSDANRLSVGKTGVPGEAATAATQYIASEWDAAAASNKEMIQEQNKTTGRQGTNADHKKECWKSSQRIHQHVNYLKKIKKKTKLLFSGV